MRSSPLPVSVRSRKAGYEREKAWVQNDALVEVCAASEFNHWSGEMAPSLICVHLAEKNNVLTKGMDLRSGLERGNEFIIADTHI